MGELPRILFFCINGTGMGHLTRCLAYARRMEGRARPVFFSLAAAVEIINDMGFEAEYFVSESWSRSKNRAWNRELAVRLGIMLEEVRPAAMVFDGTWPFHGLMNACDAYGVPLRVWSNRGLLRKDCDPVPVDERAFDLVIEPGEIGSQLTVRRAQCPGRKVTTQPVTVLRRDELLTRGAARDALGLTRDGRYALMSLSNFKHGDEIALGLIEELLRHHFTVVWVRAPISVKDVPIPDRAISIAVYPVVRYMRAFDVFVGAAGYNTCCEVIQAAVPSLLVPNPIATDDQMRRADMASLYAPIVASDCVTRERRHNAVLRLLELRRERPEHAATELQGAQTAADEILALLQQRIAA